MVDADNSARTADDLSYLDNIHQGRRCFICCTGPSLGEITTEQWAEIDKDITIGVNTIAATHPKTDYLVIIEDFTPLMAFVSMSEAKTKLVWEQHANHRECFKEYKQFRIHDSKPYFAPSINEGMVILGTVACTAINLAYIMGCNPIILLGVDFNNQAHAVPLPGDDPEKWYELAKPGRLGSKFEQPHQRRGVTELRNTAEFCEEKGVKVYNANLNSYIESFEKKPLETILSANPAPKPKRKSHRPNTGPKRKQRDTA